MNRTIRWHVPHRTFQSAYLQHSIVFREVVRPWVQRSRPRNNYRRAAIPSRSAIELRTTERRPRMNGRMRCRRFTVLGKKTRRHKCGQDSQTHGTGQVCRCQWRVNVVRNRTKDSTNQLNKPSYPGHDAAEDVPKKKHSASPQTLNFGSARRGLHELILHWRSGPRFPPHNSTA